MAIYAIETHVSISLSSINIDRAREALTSADKLLIIAGAGMSVDSGLPDFRGNAGFWEHYPVLASGKLHFEDIANPASFETHPLLAWGFYEHRRHLYRQTEPHAGYRWLLEFGQTMPGEAFVYTTNVDGHFLKAGFREDQIYEVHGSIHHWQCLHDCSNDIWDASRRLLPVDVSSCQLEGDLPRCPSCARVARPNILMFSDRTWQERRSQRQAINYQNWLNEPGQLVIVEIGAGTDIATCRWESERHDEGQLIRINPRDATCPENAISLPLGGLEALAQILK